MAEARPGRSFLVGWVIWGNEVKADVTKSLAVFAVTLSAGSAAAAIPNAASVASPPLVVGGMLVGLLLLVLFIGLLVKTFRRMAAVRTTSTVDLAQREADLRVAEWEDSLDLNVVRALIDNLHLAETAGEREVFSVALAEITGRFFGTDEVAWEVWWRRDSQALLVEMRRRLNPAPPLAGEYLHVN